MYELLFSPQAAYYVLPAPPVRQNAATRGPFLFMASTMQGGGRRLVSKGACHLRLSGTRKRREAVYP